MDFKISGGKVRRFARGEAVEGVNVPLRYTELIGVRTYHRERMTWLQASVFILPGGRIALAPWIKDSPAGRQTCLCFAWSDKNDFGWRPANNINHALQRVLGGSRGEEVGRTRVSAHVTVTGPRPNMHVSFHAHWHPASVPQWKWVHTDGCLSASWKTADRDAVAMAREFAAGRLDAPVLIDWLTEHGPPEFFPAGAHALLKSDAQIARDKGEFLSYRVWFFMDQGQRHETGWRCRTPEEAHEFAALQMRRNPAYRSYAISGCYDHPTHPEVERVSWEGQ